MPELGGPTTQSGILYQNSIAALYLGRLCDSVTFPPNERVTMVQSEALTSVDDVILTYADAHREYIQAKEVLEPSGGPWDELWRRFVKQFISEDFRPTRDRLILHVGEYRDEWRALRGMSDRSEGNADFDQWCGRLNKPQRRMLGRIQGVLKAEGLDDENQRRLLGCIEVREGPIADLKLRAYRDMPSCNVSPATLFRILRDRAGEYASRRKPIYREELMASLLCDHGITFECSSAATEQRPASHLAFLPEDRSRLQWFVSSRLQDDCMRQERDAAMEAINATSFVTSWAWEHDVPAGDYPYEETCLHFAAKSDGLVLLVDADVSPLCIKEYTAAVSAKKTCQIFIKAGSVLDRAAKLFIDEQRRKGSNPIRFCSLDELKTSLSKSLHAECIRKFRHYDHALLATTVEQARMP